MRENLTTLEILAIIMGILQCSQEICTPQSIVPSNFIDELCDNIEEVYTYIIDHRYGELIRNCIAYGNKLMEHHVECINAIYNTVLDLSHFFSQGRITSEFIKIYKLSYYMIVRHCTLSSNFLPQVIETLKLVLPEQVFSHDRQKGEEQSLLNGSSIYRCSFCNQTETHEKAKFTYIDICSHLVCQACVEQRFNRRAGSKYVTIVNITKYT